NRYATAAATSAPSVSPPPWTPVLAPVPRKLNLSVETLRCHNASATADTTLLYIFPPCSGWGWQSTTPTSRFPVASHTRPSNVRSPAGKVTFLSTRSLLTTRTHYITSYAQGLIRMMPQRYNGRKTFLAPPGSGTYNVPHCRGTAARCLRVR